MTDKRFNADLKKTLRDLEQRIKTKAIPAMLKEIAAEVITIIVRRTRLGYGVSKSGGDRERLAPLASSTIRQRASFVGLSQFTTPKRSNLTRTGHMLDSLVVKQMTTKEVKIGFADSFAERKAMWAHEGSSHRPQRPFLALSRLEVNQLLRFIRANRPAL